MRAFLLAGLGLSLVLASTVSFAADKPDTSAKLVCPVSGQPVDKSVSSDFNGGKVCFCCAKCKAKFDKSSAKFAAKANLQLVASGQAKQTKCPFTGGSMNATNVVTVGGVDVQFCCAKCKGKVAAAKPDKQIDLVFGAKGFAKGFTVAKD